MGELKGDRLVAEVGMLAAEVGKLAVGVGKLAAGVKVEGVEV